MYFVYEKNNSQEDWHANEVCRTEKKEIAFAVKNRRLKRGIEIFIYDNDTEIWRGMSI